MTAMRDTFADEAHFVSYIAALRDAHAQSLERERQRKAAGTFKERKPGQVLWVRWRGKHQILECLYSLGRPVAELRLEFVSLVDEFGNLEAVASSSPNTDLLVTLCSWAVLLDAEEAALVLGMVLARDGAFHTRSAGLLAHFGIHPKTADSRNPMNDYWVGRARNAVADGDGQAASEVLHNFVNEEWFQDTYNSGLRVITHTGDKIGHVGYWCYEAAAFAKILGIDDSRLRNHKYYPWDLAHHD